jgi:hypothetical protein
VQALVRKGVAVEKVLMSLMPTRTVPPGDDLDGLLRAFYRKEMPVRWPAAPVPPARTLPFRRPTPRGSLLRSRFALAASVALLVLGSLFASSKVAPDRPVDPNALPTLLGPGSATKPTLPQKKVNTSLSLEQPPMGETQIKVDVMLEDVPPAR